ncbi:MAG: transcriptional regulator, partial [Thermomonas sp.]
MGTMEFSGFRLDPVTRQLSGADGVTVPLTGRAFDVLEFLILHRDRVVGREELFLAVWRGRVVEENNLSQAIATLRRAFGTDAGDHAFILTVPGRGYRFVAPIHAIGDQRSIAGPALAAPSTPGEARAWLRPPLQLALLGLVAAVLLLAAWAVLVRRDGPAVQAKAASGIPARVLVLPFRPIGAPSNDAILELGMADTLITRLGDA